MTEKLPFNIHAKTASHSPKHARPAEMFLLVDKESRRLLVDPDMNNMNCVFNKHSDAEKYQANILGELRGQTDIVIKYPQFLNMAEVKQLEKIEAKCEEMLEEK
jgi:hypothetical protein